MEYKYITYNVVDSVGLIMLNRPDVLNSFCLDMALEFHHALDDVAHNKEVRACLITGNGRGFCAGQDLDEAIAADSAKDRKNLGEYVDRSYNPMVRKIRSIEKPIICAVNGVAAGAGANLALCCDIVFAAENASFIQSFCKIGVVPDTGGSFFLPRLIGFGRASALMMLCDKVTAAQALEMGMIYKVVQKECLLEEATETARYLATQPTKALGYTKRALNASITNNLEQQLDFERELQTLAGDSGDYKEGVQAFLEKRKPNFTGN